MAVMVGMIIIARTTFSPWRTLSPVISGIEQPGPAQPCTEGGVHIISHDRDEHDQAPQAEDDRGNGSEKFDQLADRSAKPYGGLLGQKDGGGQRQGHGDEKGHRAREKGAGRERHDARTRSSCHPMRSS